LTEKQLWKPLLTSQEKKDLPHYRVQRGETSSLFGCADLRE
jgi:hypothetical protein